MGSVAQAGAVDPATAVREMIEEKIFGDSEIVDEAELLQDDPDSGCLRDSLVGWSVMNSIDPHLAFIRSPQTGDDVAKRALAGAVLADEGVNFGCSQIEIHVDQDRTSVGFGEAFRLQERSHILR